MKNFKNKKQLQIMIFVFIAVISLGVGYAAITAINLMINGNATGTFNQANFKVKFTTANVTTGTGTASINNNDPKVATFDVTGLTKEGDTAVASYTVLNDSEGIGASIGLAVTNSNSEYFSVEESIADTELQAGETTTATVRVTMIKTPIESEVTTSITGTLTASPLENANATGSVGATVTPAPPNYFATDSWSTIQTNVHSGNTSRYNVGDTKTVTINGNDYTVRVANKSTAANCSNEGYSETACGFVVEFVDIVATCGCADNYTGSQAYSIISSLYNQMPNELKDVIATTRVLSYPDFKDPYEECLINEYEESEEACRENYSTSPIIIYDKLYLLSGTEVMGENSEETGVVKTSTSQLDYYSHQSTGTYNGLYVTRITIPAAVKKYNGEDKYWYLRIPDYNYNNIGGLRIVWRGFDDGSDVIGCDSGNGGVSPAFRIE